MTTRFERDTAVTQVDDGVFEARLDPAWWVARGPNGGYLTAIILRAVSEVVADPARVPRSLTVHFVAPPAEGTVQVHAVVERTGRSLTSVSVRMLQEDRLIALAMAAVSIPRPGPEFCDLVMPDVAPPEAIEPRPAPPEAPEIARRWDMRWAIGEQPFTGARAHEAVGGGWIRLESPQVFDAAVLAAVTDAWIPPILSRTDELMIVPTIDLTVHFRAELPHPGVPLDGFLLVVFRTNVAADGFLEEDGEVWAPDGTLLAQSRQLAAMLPLRSSGAATS